MYSDWVEITATGAVFITLVTALLIWDLILTILIWKNKSFLTELFPKSGERDIRKKFEEILSEVNDFDGKLIGLSKKIVNLEQDSLGYTQKVSLIRYNPYEDVGGDQSFSVAFLDKNNTGVVVTSLHTRSGTRVFAKPVNQGKSEKYEFSKEEQKVVKEAIS